MEVVPGGYLVEFQDELPASGQANGTGTREPGLRDLRRSVIERENAARASLGLSRASEREVIVHDYRLLFNGVAARLQPSAAEDLRKMSGIKGVWRERVMRVSPEPASTFESQLPGIPEGLPYTGRGTVIAVVDTGVDYRHPDLGGCFGPGCKVIGGYDFAYRDSDPLDEFGHGTHVAGIAAANGEIRGVAPDAQLLAVKVLSDQGSGPEGDVIAGIEWAVTNGADVINVSLGGPPWPENDPLSRAVEKAVESGVVVVVSAGNSGPDYYTIGSPGIAQKAITVGASEGDKVAEFSSCGPTIDRFLIKPDLLAPGVNIRSTMPIDFGLSEPYGKNSGTSMSAPYVSGAAALLIERSPDWSPLQIKHGLVAHARDFSVNAFVQGAGHIDIEKALSSATTISEGPIGLGLLYPSGGDLSRGIPVEFTNSSNQSLVYDLQLDPLPPAGLVVGLSTNRLELAPGETALITMGVAAYNALLPASSAFPCDYSTTLVARAGTDTLRLPISVIKGTVLNVKLHNTGFEPGKGPAPAYVVVHDGKGQMYVEGPDWVEAGGAFRLVVPPGSYDLVANFGHAIVLNEGLVLESELDVTLDFSDAVHEVNFRPRFPGNPGRLSFLMHGIIVHKSSGLGLPFTLFEPTLLSSNISDKYSLELTLLAASHDRPSSLYTVTSAIATGVSRSEILENDPKDFYPVRLDHSLRRTEGKFRTGAHLSLGTQEFGWGFVTGSGRPDDDGSRYWYLNVPRTPVYAPPLLFEYFDRIGTHYKTAGWRAVSRSELRSSPAADPDIVLTSGTPNSLPAGIGPLYWFGRFANSADQIAVRSGAQGIIPRIILGQAGDDPTLGSIRFELRKDGTAVKTGLLSPNPRGGIAVDPGPQDLVLDALPLMGTVQPFRVVANFDTTRSDPDPPYIIGFRLSKAGELTEVLSATQPRQLSIRVGDDTGVSKVALGYRAGDKEEEIPLTRIGPDEYRAELPLLTSAPLADLWLDLADTSGNSIRFQTSVLRGFPDLTVKASSQELPIGRTVGRQVTVSNNGFDSTDSAIAVTEQLPEGVTFVSAAGEGWSCTSTGRTLICRTTNRLNPISSTSFITYLRADRIAAPNAQGTITVQTAEDEEHGNDSFVYGLPLKGTSWWAALGPDGGEVYALTTDPHEADTLYAGTRGQIWRSEDLGASWTPLTRSLPDAPISAIAMDPTRPEVMYAGTDGYGVFKSTDAGKNWSGISASAVASATVIVIRVDPSRPDNIYAGFARGSERSTDGGATWETLPLENSPGVSDFAFHPTDKAVVYAGTAAGIFRSSDAGSHWSLSVALSNVVVNGLFDGSEDPGNHLRWIRFAFDPDNPSKLFATTMAGLYLTTDNGSSWQPDPKLTRLRGGDIVIASDPDRTIYIVNGTMINRRGRNDTVYGGRFVGFGPMFAVDHLLLAADGTTLYVGTRSGIYFSQNRAEDWVSAGAISAVGTKSLIADPHQPGLFYLLTNQGVITGSGGREWISAPFRNLRMIPNFLVADPLRHGTLYAAGSDGIYKTTNAGKDWDVASQGLPAEALENLSAFALDPRNGTSLYLGTSPPADGVGLFRSLDGGGSWQAAATGLPGSAGVSCLAVDPGKGTVYAGIVTGESSGSQVFGLFRSSNGGASWQPVGNGLPAARINLLVFGGPAIPGALFIGTEGAGICRSDDDAMNWTPISQGLGPSADIRAIVLGPSGDLFVAAYGLGVFRSADTGAHWEAYDEGLTSRWVTSLVFDPNDPRALYVGTESGVFSMTLSPDFALSARRTAKVLTGGAAVWSLDLANQGSAANSAPAELEFKVPPGLRLLRSSGAGWTCADGATAVRCMTQARMEPRKSTPSLSLTFEVDEQAESPMSAEIRSDASEDVSPQNDAVVDQYDVARGLVSRIPFLRTDPEMFAGLALSNLSPLTAQVVLTALDKEGKLVDQPRNPLFLTLEPDSQLARLTSELFGESQEPTAEGWVRIAADQPVANVYQIGGEQQLDGGIGAQSLSRTLYFTRICEGKGACWGQTGRTIIGLANPGRNPVTVRMVLYGYGSGLPRESNRLIPGKGSLAGSLSECFGLTVWGAFTVPGRPVTGGYVKVEVVQGDGGIVGSEQIELTEGRSLVSLPAQSSTPGTVLYSAQLADLPGFFTRVQLVNSSQEVRSVRVRAFGDDGQPITEQKDFVLDGLSSLDADCGNWLEWLPGRSRIGTLIVEADGPGLLGDVAFGGRKGETAAALPLQSAPAKTLRFAQVADGMGLYTGLALYNPGIEPAEVSISVSAGDGTIAGQATFTLEAGTRLSKLVSELMPSTSGLIGGGVTVSANHPIIGQQLFGTAKFLSAVPPSEVEWLSVPPSQSEP